MMHIFVLIVVIYEGLMFSSSHSFISLTYQKLNAMNTLVFIFCRSYIHCGMYTDSFSNQAWGCDEKWMSELMPGVLPRGRRVRIFSPKYTGVLLILDLDSGEE